VYVVGSRDLSLLFKYRHEKRFAAEDADPGAKDSLHGRNGDDLTIPFPIGSIITNKETGDVVEVLSEEPILLLKGGRGGLGNEHFKSPTHRSPTRITLGRVGEEGDFYVELRLVVDLGLVGFPNAGKSSLLNALTNASAKVGAYQFTTLEPNLGAFQGYIIADIPGLIEGAAEGKGLGHKFLRHVSRTKTLVHLISLENEDVVAAYQAIRAELEAFDKELATKEEIILLTKTDEVDEKAVAAAKKKLAKFKKPVFAVSMLDDAAIKTFADELVKLLRGKETNK